MSNIQLTTTTSNIDTNKLVKKAYDYYIWEQPFYSYENSEPKDRYSNIAYIWLKHHEFTWNGNLCATANWLMANCPEKFISALEQAESELSRITTIDINWTGNKYRDGNTYLACEVETPYGLIPFAAYKPKETTRQHVGYDAATVRLHKD